MGYPMSWVRILERNAGRATSVDMFGEPQESGVAQAFLSDLTRLHTDSLDPLHLQWYAGVAGITQEQARLLLEAFFTQHPSIGSTLKADGQYLGALFQGSEIVATHPVKMPPGTFLVVAKEEEVRVS